MHTNIQSSAVHNTQKVGEKLQNAHQLNGLIKDYVSTPWNITQHYTFKTLQKTTDCLKQNQHQCIGGL